MSFNRIIGTNEKDDLNGTAGADFISGLGKDDWIYAYAGNDSAEGGAGNDAIRGYEGNDTLLGGDGDDDLSGNEGDDSLDGGDGNDEVHGYGGKDTLAGGGGNDTLSSSDGLDSLAGGDGDDWLQTSSDNQESNTLDGGAGNDTLYGADWHDTLTGGDGDDVLDGNSGNDTLEAGAGADQLSGGEGKDSLVGGEGADGLDGEGGDDTLTGGGGNDLVRGGGGVDVAVFSGVASDYSWVPIEGTNRFTVEDKRAGSPDGLDTLQEIEFLQFADKKLSFADAFLFPTVIIGGNVKDYFDGTAGADFISGLGKDDRIYAYAGNDSAEGGAGNDAIHGYEGNDTLLGGDGEDYLSGNDGNDSLDGGDGNDQLHGYDGKDTLAGGGGNDTLSSSGGLDSLAGGDGDDLLQTSSDNEESNTLDGGAGNDTLYGADWHDTLTGGDGDDVLDGNSGNDTFFGGKGRDSIQGNEGADMAVFSGAASDYLLIPLDGLKVFSMLDRRTNSPDGLDTLQGIEFLRFGVKMFAAADFLNGSADTVRGTAGADFLVAYRDGQFVDALAGDDTLTASTFKNATLAAAEGNDSLVGNGTSSMVGGTGNDTYLANAGDKIVETANGGTDLVRSGGSHTLGAHIENLELTGFARANGTGNSLPNLLIGNAMDNLLSGGTGNDTIASGFGRDTVRGGAGSDSLLVEWTALAPTTIERYITMQGSGASASFSGYYTAKNAVGQVLASVDFDGIESVTLNRQAVNLVQAIATPGVGARRISSAAATTEQGGAVEFDVTLQKAPFEAVTLSFTTSDATEAKVKSPALTFTPQNWNKPQRLVIEGVDDFLDDGDVAFNVRGKIVTKDLTYNRVVVPSISLVNKDDGNDKPIVFAGTPGVDYFQGKNGNDTLYGGQNQDELRGGRGNDELFGEQDNDRLLGELGNDKIYGGYGGDSLDGGTGADSLFGEQGLDTLAGGIGNDYLDGGIENDSMSGGAGNDTYVVDSAGDRINDLGASTDVDTVQVIQTISYTLPSNIENAAITAGGSGNLTGNSLNNGLTGNDSRNVLDGGSGNDRLAGEGGADSLVGGAGNDAFLGGLGNDTMRGGVGVDLADFAAAGVDIRVDLSTGRVTGEGTDLLFDIENILAGDGQDTLLGNTAGNDLDGGAGIDSLNGGAGNDTLAGCFFGANGGRAEIDTLVGGAGVDVFQLGWASGRFYDDGNTKNAGRFDYVLISDFAVGQDKLQLDGAAANYYLGASGVSGVTGTGLWAEQGATDELIAIIRSANTTTLNTANTVNTGLFV